MRTKSHYELEMQYKRLLKQAFPKLQFHGITWNWYGSKKAEVINDTAQLAKVVTRQMKHELKVRDLDSLYDFINSQY